jgi:hypothetical protein
MPNQARSRRRSVLASGLAAAAIALAAASCSQITPLGPTGGPKPTPGAVRATPLGLVSTLGSPIILQVMHGKPATGTGGCPAGQVQVSLPPGAAPMPCFQPVGAPVTITTAAVSPFSTYHPAPPPGQPAPPVSFGFVVGVLPAQVAAVTALITQAYHSRDALGISVDGKLWQAPQVFQPFTGQQFQIALLNRNQALQLYHLLVPAG